MDKREIFDALDGFSQTLLMTLAEVDAIRKTLQEVVAENTDLQLENIKLRERLAEIAANELAHSHKVHNTGRTNLEKIYDDGFHICTYFYGQRRDNDEACAFCDELLHRE